MDATTITVQRGGIRLMDDLIKRQDAIRVLNAKCKSVERKEE